MTAVIYARYSSDNQREESIEGQIRECTAYAEKNGITVVKHYIDRALSAKTDNRPDFQQMIKDSEKRLFDIVLVWKLSLIWLRLPFPISTRNLSRRILELEAFFFFSAIFHLSSLTASASLHSIYF